MLKALIFFVLCSVTYAQTDLNYRPALHSGEVDFTSKGVEGQSNSSFKFRVDGAYSRSRYQTDEYLEAFMAGWAEFEEAFAAPTALKIEDFCKKTWPSIDGELCTPNPEHYKHLFNGLLKEEFGPTLQERFKKNLVDKISINVLYSHYYARHKFREQDYGPGELKLRLMSLAKRNYQNSLYSNDFDDRFYSRETTIKKKVFSFVENLLTPQRFDELHKLVQGIKAKLPKRYKRIPRHKRCTFMGEHESMTGCFFPFELAIRYDKSRNLFEFAEVTAMTSKAQYRVTEGFDASVSLLGFFHYSGQGPLSYSITSIRLFEPGVAYTRNIGRNFTFNIEGSADLSWGWYEIRSQLTNSNFTQKDIVDEVNFSYVARPELETSLKLALGSGHIKSLKLTGNASALFMGRLGADDLTRSNASYAPMFITGHREFSLGGKVSAEFLKDNLHFFVKVQGQRTELDVQNVEPGDNWPADSFKGTREQKVFGAQELSTGLEFKF